MGYNIHVGDTLKLALGDRVRKAKVLDIYRAGGTVYFKVYFGGWLFGYEYVYDEPLLRHVLDKAHDLEGREHLSSIEI